MSWQNLTIRLKQEVVGLLDYESRCNLRLSSKDDKDVVDSTKFKFKKVKITEIQSKKSQGKTIIRCEMDSLTIWLIGKENLTRIDRGWNGEIIEELSEIKHEHRYEIFHRFLDWITHKGVIQAESVEVDGIRFHPPQKISFKCQNLTIRNIGIQYFSTWMPKFISKKYKNLDITVDGELEEHQVWSMISNLEVTKCLQIENDTVMTDEELEKIEALDLRFYSERITVDGARRKLEKFLKFGTEDDLLDLRFRLIENFNAFDQIFSKNWKMKVIPREHTREEEYSGIITSGFENVHGILKPRQIDVAIHGEMIRIWCAIYSPQP